MEEDPVIILLKRHFEKVTQCLENNKNFDILTRFSFSSTSDKATENTEFQFNDEYINPELEYAQELPEKQLDATFVPLPNSSLQDLFEVVQAETNLEVEFQQESFRKDTKSSSFHSKDNMKHKILDGELGENHQPSSKSSSRKSIIERPDTPYLEMYDFDDEEHIYVSPKLQKMGASRKFMSLPPMLLRNEEKTSSEDQDILSEPQFDGREEVEIIPIADESPPSLISFTSKDDGSNFEQELEQYKKDIKFEKAIKSLSTTDTIPQVRNTTRIHHPSFSYDSCLKNTRRENKSDIQKKETNETSRRNSPQYETGIRTETPVMEQTDTSEYLKDLFEDSCTNVCRGSPTVKSSLNFHFLQNDPEISQKKVIVDDEMLESIFEKFFRGHVCNNNSKEYGSLKASVVSEENVKPSTAEMNFATKSYIMMNHLEIQKEMAKRIEDLYKAGDAK